MESSYLLEGTADEGKPLIWHIHLTTGQRDACTHIRLTTDWYGWAAHCGLTILL